MKKTPINDAIDIVIKNQLDEQTKLIVKEIRDSWNTIRYSDKVISFNGELFIKPKFSKIWRDLNE